jgi:hypothetical protein
MDWMVGFFDPLFTQLGATGNYSAISDLHTLQLTVTRTLGKIYNGTVYTTIILKETK